METTLIEESLTSYNAIATHLQVIEKAMRGQETERILGLSQQLLQLQEDVKANDTHILDLVQTNPNIRQAPRLQELIDLMRQIHQYNDRLTTHLRSMMVVYRDELMKMKRGNTVLQGYRPVTQHTGRKNFHC